jgi:hypothetical protein
MLFATTRTRIEPNAATALSLQMRHLTKLEAAGSPQPSTQPFLPTPGSFVSTDDRTARFASGGRGPPTAARSGRAVNRLSSGNFAGSFHMSWSRRGFDSIGVEVTWMRTRKFSRIGSPRMPGYNARERISSWARACWYTERWSCHHVDRITARTKASGSDFFQPGPSARRFLGAAFERRGGADAGCRPHDPDRDETTCDRRCCPHTGFVRFARKARRYRMN